jgi:hypothetical protein
LISELGVRGTDEVIALSEDNDPFYSGRPAHVKDGEWFAALWQRFGLSRGTGIHLRAIHYKLVVTADVSKPNGTPYVNTEKCWKYLQAAAKCARYLGLVDANDIVDQAQPGRAPIRHLSRVPARANGKRPGAGVEAAGNHSQPLVVAPSARSGSRRL